MIYESDLTLAKFDTLDSCCKDTLDDMRHDPDPYARGMAEAEAGTSYETSYDYRRDAAW